MTSCRILTPDTFAQLPPAWQQLVEQCPDSGFDQTFAWYRAFDQLILGSDEKLAIFAVGSDDQPQALLPMVTRPAGVALRGKRIDAMANYYTAEFAPILSISANATAIGEVIADHLCSSGRWPVIDLNPIDPNAEWARALTARLQHNGLYLQQYFRFANWYLNVAGRSFDEYFQSRPTALRDTVRRKLAKLEKKPNAEIIVPVAAEDLSAALDDYDVVYQHSWKKPEPYFDFIRQVVMDAGQANEVRLGLIRVGGRPVAAQIWFVRNGVASIFKLAHDSDFASLSAGSILTTHLMRHVIDVDGVDVVDYLSGDEPYKKNWMSDRRERCGLRAFRLSTLAGATGAVWSLAGRAARHVHALTDKGGKK